MKKKFAFLAVFLAVIMALYVATLVAYMLHPLAKNTMSEIARPSPAPKT